MHKCAFDRRDVNLWLCFASGSQMQQQEQAQIRQRDANLTALAAIGPRKKRKMDSPGSSNAGAEVRDTLSHTQTSVTHTLSHTLTQSHTLSHTQKSTKRHKALVLI